MSRFRLSARASISPLFAAAAIAALSVPSSAQHIGDITLQPLGGRINTGAILDSPNGPILKPGVRVFASEFGEVLPNTTDEPGFESAGPPAAAFPEGTLLSFDILDALHKWDGNTFDAVPAETLRVAKGATSVETPPGLNQVRAGFAFAQVSGGLVHDHLRFTLLSPQSTGVYVLQLRLRTSAVGIADSLPFWIVFNQNAPESEHDAAIAYMNSLVTPACPGDLTGDSAVNTADLTRFLSTFGRPVVRYAHGDFNGDGDVNTADLTFFLARFGDVCP